MITYRVCGALPRILPVSLLPRVARCCASTSGVIPRGTWDIGVRCVSSRAMQELNRRYRGYRRPTDVLSFQADGTPLGVKEPGELGDLVLCASVAIREARRRMIDPTEEMVRLLVHGTLHLSGYDHVTVREEERMFFLQEGIVERVFRGFVRRRRV
jgi:rRNA maturation RNase YbeY